MSAVQSKGVKPAATKAQRRAKARKAARKKKTVEVLVVGKNVKGKPRQRKPRAKPVYGPMPNPGGVTAKGVGAYHLSGDVSWGIPGVFGGSLRGGLSDGAVTGSGAYKVKRNSLAGAIDLTGTVPRVKNMQKGEAFVVSHREYIKDITSGDFAEGLESSVFKLESWNLNPSNSELFPWLSSISQNFQEYRVTGMLVEYKTMASDFTTALGLGTVIMTADYNVLAEPPENKQLMENMENAGSCKPSCSLIMPIECAPSQTSVSTHLYVGPLSAEDGDLRLYDLCKIYLATFGVPVANAPIGELWVTYEIAFYKPKLLEFPTNQTNISWAATWTDSSVADPLPDNIVIHPRASPLFEFVPAVPEVSLAYIKFPEAVGQLFFVNFYWNASVTATGTGNVPTVLGANLELVEMNYGTGETYQKNPHTTTINLVKTMSVSYLFKVTEEDPTSKPVLSFGDDGDFTTSVLTCHISLWNKEFEILEPSVFKEPKFKSLEKTRDGKSSFQGREIRVRPDHCDIEECDGPLISLRYGDDKTWSREVSMSTQPRAPVKVFSVVK
jgi:hypothetical protein